MERGRHCYLRQLTSACFLAALGTLPFPASAQDGPAGAGAPQGGGGVAGASGAPATQLEEIVVTAQRRAENLEKAPVAVTAVSGDTLRALNITSAQGLAQVVPNLVIGQNGSSAQVGIRGAISTTPGPFADPAVGFSVDGVYLARASAALSRRFTISARSRFCAARKERCTAATRSPASST